MKSYIVKGLLPLLEIICFGGTRVAAQCSELYGITFGGGEYGGGTLFKTDGNGDHLKTVHSFFRYEGLPQSLCKSGGKFYGLITGQELYFQGTGSTGGIYEYNPVLGTYVRRFKITDAEMGAGLSGAMTEGSNGILYGMMQKGGSHRAGVIFGWVPATNEYSKKIDFDGTETGAYPKGSLLKANNGKYYGAASGGQYESGVIFEWDADSNKYKKLFDFNGQNGSQPCGSLMQADNGKLYGMTTFGGEYEKGVIYELDPATGCFTKKIDFSGADNGESPRGSLIQASNGKLYGLTPYGGANGHFEGEWGWITDGVLFEWDPNTNILKKKFDFKFGANGYQPDGTLLNACGDKLYGRTSYGGGPNNRGVIFEFDLTTDSMTQKLEFDFYKLDAMIVTDSCTILGVTYKDKGISGAFVEWDPLSNTFTDKLTFLMAENGVLPVGHLIAAENKKIYGMTGSGGKYNRGLLFEWNPASGAYSKKYDFEGSDSGGSPGGSLVQTSNGKLYGMAHDGGEYGKGVLFEWDPVTGVYTKKVDFNGGDMGGYPNGTLIQAQNGKLYGMTPSGGEPDEWGQTKGVLFEWDPVTGIFSKKVNFNGAEKGSNPSPSLTEATNGKLYGVTRTGGRNNAGVLFEWDPDQDLFTKNLDFSRDSGLAPFGSLILAKNDKLYGITNGGGKYEEGVIFEWDPLTDTYSKKLDLLHYPHQGKPYGSMVQGVNGKFYGIVVGIPEANDHAVLFEYDPATNNYSEKTDTVSGMSSYYYSDGLVSRYYSNSDTIDVVSYESYVSPSGKFTWTVSGVYNDTISSAAGCDSVITINLMVNHIIDLAANTFTSGISLYPNPTEGAITIDLGKTYPNAEITISELDGRVVSKDFIMNARFKDLRLSGSPGLYIIGVVSGNERAVYKISLK
jgi:uncharacterized repeat protein (TIGR03803 family)